MIDSKIPNCAACHDSGWVAFTRIHHGQRLPWSAACHCDKGLSLSSPREHSESSRKGGAWAPPVVVEPIDKDIYYARLAEAADRSKHP